MIHDDDVEEDVGDLVVSVLSQGVTGSVALPLSGQKVTG